MSRIGKIPVPVPDKVKVAITADGSGGGRPAGQAEAGAVAGGRASSYDEAAKKLVVSRKDDGRQARPCTG